MKTFRSLVGMIPNMSMAWYTCIYTYLFVSIIKTHQHYFDSYFIYLIYHPYMYINTGVDIIIGIDKLGRGPV